MKNRDYFTKPIQSGGRSSSDYGRTRLAVDRAGSNRLWWAGIAMVVLYFVWQVTR
jgi:hypothetical protein